MAAMPTLAADGAVRSAGAPADRLSAPAPVDAQRTS
jgi:hypothetical protein